MTAARAGSLTDLRRTARDLTRTVRRHRALLAAGLAAAAVASALPILAPTPPAMATVLAAAHDLPPGRPLTATDLTRLALPAGAVPDGALLDAGEAVGRSLTGPVRRGEALTDLRLLGSGLVRTAGLVAVPVRLADAASATLLRAGDRVDVLAVPADGGVIAATTVAAGLSVLAVPGSPADGEGALIVLAATPATAARLAAAAVGSRLSVTVLGS